MPSKIFAHLLRKQVVSSEASQEQPQQIIMASNDDIEKGKTDHLKSMKSASINALFKKSRKMNKISTTEKTKPSGKKYAVER